MYVSVADTDTVEVLGQLLRHTLREGRNKHLLTLVDSARNLLQKVIDLVVRRSHLNLGVEQTCGSHKLLNHRAFALDKFVVGGGGTTIQNRIAEALKFGKCEGSVVDGCGQAEAILHKVLLASPIATKHSPHLRNGNMALIDHKQEVLGEIVEQAEGAFTLLPAVHIARVVLNTRAVAELLYHLHIVLHPLLNALSLNRSPSLLELLDAGAEVELYLSDSTLCTLLGGNKEVCGEDMHLRSALQASTRSGVDAPHSLHLIAKHRHPPSIALRVGGHNIYRVALNPKCSGLQVSLRTGVECIDKAIEESSLGYHITNLDGYAIGVEIGGVADTIEARHARHHNNISPTRK